MPLCQRAARRLRRPRRPIRKNPPPQARTRAAPSAARSSPSAGRRCQSVLMRGGYLRPNDGARLCTRSVGPRKPPSKHSAYVRTAARLPSQRQARPHVGKAALVNQRRLHARGGREARIRLLHLPLPYFFDFIRAPGRETLLRPAICGPKRGFLRSKSGFRHAEYGSPPRKYTYPAVCSVLYLARRHGGGSQFAQAAHRSLAVSAADVRQNPPDSSARGRCGGAQRRLIRRGEQPVNIDCAADFRVRKRPANARRGSAFLIARHTVGGMQNMHSIRQLEKSAGCIANSPFFRPKSRLPARIATVTV